MFVGCQQSSAPNELGPLAEVVEITPSTATVSVGAGVQLTATVRDASGNVLTGRVVTWSSSSTSVATVNSGGLVTGRGAGTATMTATSEGQSGTATIQVTGGGGGGAPVLFESSWNYATGSSDNAVLDGPPGNRKWDTWNGDGPIVDIEASGGALGSFPGGDNAMTVDQVGIEYYLVENIGAWDPGRTPGVDIPRDVAIRFYVQVRNPVGTQYDHGVQAHNLQYPNTWGYGHFDLSGGFNIIHQTGINFPPNPAWTFYDNIGAGNRAVLTRGDWYRYEFLLKFNSLSQFRMYPRIYSVSAGTILTSAAGSLLYDWNAVGTDNENLPPQTVMRTYYDGGGWVTYDEMGVQVMNSLFFGNNGQAGNRPNGTNSWLFNQVKVVDGTLLNENSPVWVGDLSGQ
jgi:Bacterial Ig-like domain (group 2)